MGRPKKENKKEYKITIRMTKEEYDEFLFLSKMSHLNRSEYIKSAMIAKNAEIRNVLNLRKAEFDDGLNDEDDFEWY